MSLASLPDLVIARLRAQCPIFGNRVAGTAAEARAADNVEFPVPHAFFVPGSLEPDEDTEISELDQRFTFRFAVLVAVDNSSDERGQAGAAGVLAAVASVVHALKGWTPGADFAPILCNGMDAEYTSNRARLWKSAEFRTAIMASDL